MELRALRYFLAVAEELHFGKAAARLHISQPSLSAQIQKLEADLGGSLFIRDRHHVSLTEGGRLLMQAARTMLFQAAEAEAAVRTTLAGAAGELNLGYMNTAYSDILRIGLKAFRARYPGVRIRLREDTPSNLCEAVRLGDLDAAFVNMPVWEENRELQAEPLAAWPLCVLLPREHPLAGLDAVPMARLTDESVIDFGVEYFHGQQLFDKIPQSPVILHVTGNLQVMAGLVGAGLGVAFMPSSYAPFLPPEVVLKPVEGISFTLICLLVHRRESMEPVVRHFLACLPRFS